MGADVPPGSVRLQPAELAGVNSIPRPIGSIGDAAATKTMGSAAVQTDLMVSCGMLYSSKPITVSVSAAGNRKHVSAPVTGPRSMKPAGGCPGTANFDIQPRTSNGAHGPGLHVPLVIATVGLPLACVDVDVVRSAPAQSAKATAPARTMIHPAFMKHLRTPRRRTKVDGLGLANARAFTIDPYSAERVT